MGRLVCLVLLLLAVLSPVRAAPADDAASLSVLLTAIDSTAEWDARAQSVTAQGDGAAARGVTIARADGSLSIAIETVTVRDLGIENNGIVRFGRLTLQTTQLTAPRTTLTVPDIAFEALSVPSFASYKPDEQKPAASFGALLSHLARVSFEVAAAPSLTLELRTIDLETPSTPGTESPVAFTRNLSMKDLRAGPMTEGRLAALVARPIAFVDAGAGGVSAKGDIDRLEVAGLDLSALAAVVDPAQSPPAGPWRTTLGKLTLANLALRAQPPTPDAPSPVTQIREFTVGGVDVRRGARSVGEVLDGIVALAAAPAEDQSGMFERIFPDALSWLRLGSLSMSDLLISDGTAQGSFTLRQTLIENLSNEGLAKASFEGASMLAQGIIVGMEAVSFESVTWPSAEAWAAMSAVEEQRAAGSIESTVLERAAANFLNVYPQVGRFRIAGLSASLGATAPLTLAEILVTQETPQPSTTISRGILRQFVIPAALVAISPETAGALSGLGYTQFAFNGESETRHDRATGAYAGKSSLTMDDGGTFEAVYTCSGATDATMEAIAVPFLKAGESEADVQELSAALDGVKLEGLSMSWRDNSLVRRLVTWWAQQQQMPEAALAQGLADAAAEAVRPLNPTLAEMTRTAVNAFLLNPQSLTVTSKPPSPVGLGQLLRSATTGFPLPDIGLSIDANR